MPKKQQKYIGFNMSDRKQLRTFMFLSHLGKYTGEFISELINQYLDCHNVNVNTITRENARVIAAMAKNGTESINGAFTSKDSNATMLPDDVTHIIKEQVSEQFNAEINEAVKTQILTILDNLINIVEKNTSTTPSNHHAMQHTMPTESLTSLENIDTSKSDFQLKESDDSFNETEKEMLKSILSGF